MGLFEDAVKSFTQNTERIMPGGGGDDFEKRSRRGQLGGSDFLRVGLIGVTGTAKQRDARMSNPFQADKVFKTDLKALEAGGFAQNLGHQIFMRQKDDTSPPSVGEGEVSGETRKEAQDAARARAKAQAQARFGVGDTVATTPLGLSNDAAIGRKKLIGN